MENHLKTTKDLWNHTYLAHDYTHTSDVFYAIFVLIHTVANFYSLYLSLFTETFRPRRTNQFVMMLSIMGVLNSGISISELFTNSPAQSYFQEVMIIVLASFTGIGNSEILKRFSVNNTYLTPQRIAVFQYFLVVWVMVGVVPMLVYGSYMNDFTLAPIAIYNLGWQSEYSLTASVYVYEWTQSLYVFNHLNGLSDQMKSDQRKRSKRMSKLLKFLLIFSFIWDLLAVGFIYTLSENGNPISLSLLPWELGTYHLNYLFLQFYLIQVIYAPEKKKSIKRKEQPVERPVRVSLVATQLEEGREKEKVKEGYIPE